MGTAPYFALDQAGILQHLDVLGGSCERHGEGLGQLAHCPVPAGEFAKHLAAGRIAKSVKDLI
ncbi:hypothetical protein GCM10027320_23900 [Massilia solisilvae]